MSKLHTRKIAIPMEALFSNICSTLLPAIINVVAMYFIMDLQKESIKYVLSLVSAVGTFFLILLLHNLLPKFRFFRPFKHYEGRWLQIIPDFKIRNLSIIDFNYDKRSNRYFLKGFNFNTELSDGESKGGVAFTAHKFIERDYHDGFYYITNHTIEQKNGMGKIGFTEINYDGLTRAAGYFFDASGNEVEAKQYNTIMVKCDKYFAREIFGKKAWYTDITKMPPNALADNVREFVDAEIKAYEQIKKNSCSVKSRCQFCNCNKQKTDVSDNIEQEVESEELSTL